jgi:perosamine synthetase
VRYLEEVAGRIVLFKPHVPEGCKEAVCEVLESRWIGQGPKVDEFENTFSEFINTENRSPISVNSGTAALHLAYILSGLNGEGHVLAPVLTCTATNIPLLYGSNKIRWIDTESDTLNVSVTDIENKINKDTKAVIVVNYGGIPAKLKEISSICKEMGIPLIQDSAHALGATLENRDLSHYSDYSIFSFQAIKHLTTGDGGMLVVPAHLKEKAKRLRWFGIDRINKKSNIWDNDILEVGFKYHMNDIAAAMGIVAMKTIKEVINLRRSLHSRYERNLKDLPKLKIISQTSIEDNFEGSAWLCSILVEDREKLRTKLLENEIETGLVHYRNDRYSIFSESKETLPNMDVTEKLYLSLPLHTHMNNEDVDRICEIISTGW